MDFFITESSDHEISKEKEKAKALRKSRWWSIKLAKGICHYCGGKFDAQDITMDHIVPIVRGGKSVRSNLVPACKECNNRKKYLLPIEWKEYLERIRAGEVE